MKKKNSFSMMLSYFADRLLYSPVTYAVAALIVLYTDLYFFVVRGFFSDIGTTSIKQLFTSIPYVCIIAVPSVTSVLFSKDKENSFPCSSMVCTVSKIILISAVLVFSVLLTVPVPFAVSFFGNTDIPQIVSGYSGIILFLITSTALSVFISEIIKNPAAAFLVNAVILSAVNSAHLLAMYFNLNDALSSAVKMLSFAWHFDSSSKGIFDSRDILFYLITSAALILLTVYVKEKQRGYKLKTYRAVLCVLILILCFINSTSLFFRIDTTKEKRFSTGKFSKEALQNLDDYLYISYYYSSSLQQLYPQVRDVRDFLEEYKNLNSYIKLNVTDTSRNENASGLLMNYGISPQPLQTAGRDSTSITNVYSAIILEHVDRTEIIPFVLDTSTLEYDLTARVIALMTNTRKKIQIVYGNELSGSDYSYVKPWLESQGFYVQQKELPSKNASAENPFTVSDGTLLVIGTSAFSSGDAECLEEFILDGGKAFIASTPYSVDVKGDWSVTENKDRVTKLLKAWGVEYKNSLTADISNFRLTMVSDTKSDGSYTAERKTEYINYPLWPVLQPQTYALNGMTLCWPCALECHTAEIGEENFLPAVKPLLVTSNQAWQIEKVEGKYETNPFIIPKTAEDSSMKKQYVLSAEISGMLRGYYTTGKNPDARVTVLSDCYSLSTVMLNYTSGTSGDFRVLDFLTDRLLELENSSALVELKNKNYYTDAIYKIPQQELHSYRFKVIMLTAGIPVILIFGLWISVCVQRKRKVRNIIER